MFHERESYFMCKLNHFVDAGYHFVDYPFFLIFDRNFVYIFAL